MATTVTDLEERHVDFAEKVDGQLLDLHKIVTALEVPLPLLVISIDKLSANRTGSIQQLAGVVATMQTQLNAVLTTVQANQTQLAVLFQKSDAVAARIEVVEKKLETRLDQVEKKVDTLSWSYAAFEARGEVTNKFLKWVGGLSALAIVSFIGFGYGLARHAGSLDEKIQHHQETLNEIKAKLE